MSNAARPWRARKGKPRSSSKQRLSAPLVLATALAGRRPGTGMTAPPSAATVVATVRRETEITLGEMLIARSQLPPAIPGNCRLTCCSTELLEQLVNQQLLADALNEEPLRLTLALQNEARSLRAGEVVVGHL